MDRLKISMKAWLFILASICCSGVGALATQGILSEDMGKYVIGAIVVLATAAIGGTAYEDGKKKSNATPPAAVAGGSGDGKP